MADDWRTGKPEDAAATGDGTTIGLLKRIRDLLGGTGSVRITDGVTTATVRELGTNDALNVAITDGSGNQITSFGGGTQFAEDAAHSSGATGTLSLVVRRDADSTLVDTDGDYAPLQVNAAGALKVTGGGGGTEYVVNAVAPADPTGATFVMERDDQLAALGEVEGDWTNPRSTSKGALWVALADSSGDPITSFGGGTQYVEDVAAAADPTGTMLIAVRADTPAAVTSTDGDNIALRSTNKGEVYVKQTDAVPVTDNAGSLTVDNATLSVVGGGVEATALRVTVASDSTGVLSVDDNGGSLTVDQATASSLNAQVVGELAHDAADSGNPIKIGGRASTTTPTAVANADRVNAWFYRNGQQAVALVNSSGLENGISDPLYNRTAYQSESGTLGALNAAVTANVYLGTGAVTFEIASGLTGTVVIEANSDATNWIAINALNVVTNAVVASVSAYPVLLMVAGGGYQQVRIRVSSYGSGSSDATAFMTEGPGPVRLAEAIPAGTNNIGDVDILTIAAGDNNIGNVDIVTVPAPLSTTGGGTEATALRVTVATDSTGVLSVDDNGGSLTVDGTVTIQDGGNTITVDNGGTFVTQVNGDALTALQLIDNLVLAEDGIHGTGDPGVQMLAVRDDTLNIRSGAENDYEPLHTDANGALWTQDVNSAAQAASLSVLDDWDETNRAAVNTIAGQVGVQGASGVVTALTQRVVLATDVALPAGTNGIGKLTANSGVDIGDVDVTTVVPGTGATNLGKAEDGGHTTGDVGVMALAVRQTADAALSGADLDYEPLQTDASGFLKVNVKNTVTVGSHAVTNAGTFVVQENGAALTALQIMDDWDNAASDGASVSGDVAHDVADAGEPVKIGGKSGAAMPTAVTDTRRVNAWYDRHGAQHVRTGAEGSIPTQHTHVPAANTQATIAKSAGAAGVRNVCTQITVTLAADTTAPAAVAATVNLIDGASGGTTYLWRARLSLPAVAGATNGIVVVPCWFVGTAATALTLEFAAAGGANTFQTVSMSCIQITE